MTFLILFFCFCLVVNHCLSFSIIKGSERNNILLRSTKITPTSVVPSNVLRADGLLQALFSFKPFFSFASKNARDSMVQRGLKIGVDWTNEIENFLQNKEELKNEYDRVIDSKLLYPEYYKMPFHAYENGNLCWDAAYEVEAAALTVHAHVYTNTPKILEKDGDFKLRENFHINMRKMLKGLKPRRILDIGCSTGLSTIKLHDSFPEAEILGIDLSPYMLAVGKFELNHRPSLSSAKSHITYYHAAGEETQLGEGDVDLVTSCLIHHELPSSVARDIFQEAYRVLPFGGALAIMDMDPNSESFVKLASNPFAFAAFRSTEPWLQEYMALDIETLLEDCGFRDIQINSNSPRHRTIVAFKS